MRLPRKLIRVGWLRIPKEAPTPTAMGLENTQDVKK
jgi:hypothetical protein